jgi:hypothetical protein
MYRKITKMVEQYVRHSGKIEFHPTVKFRESEVFSGKVPYRIFFVYNDSAEEPELIGRFALSITGGTEYLMSGVVFTKQECRPGLRDLILELVVEKAIEEARGYKVSYLVIETLNPKIVEMVLNFTFQIMKFDTKDPSNHSSLYRCTKKLFFTNYSTQ